MNNTVDTTTGTIQLKATVENANNSLWPGQFATVTLRLRTETNAIVVPSQAVQSGQQGQYVFVVKPDATVESRPVVIAFANGPLTVIRQRVQAGERVVTDGQLRLVPGDELRLRHPGDGHLHQPWNSVGHVIKLNGEEGTDVPIEC